MGVLHQCLEISENQKTNFVHCQKGQRHHVNFLIYNWGSKPAPEVVKPEELLEFATNTFKEIERFAEKNGHKLAKQKLKPGKVLN